MKLGKFLNLTTTGNRLNWHFLFFLGGIGMAFYITNPLTLTLLSLAMFNNGFHAAREVSDLAILSREIKELAEAQSKSRKEAKEETQALRKEIGEAKDSASKALSMTSLRGQR